MSIYSASDFGFSIAGQLPAATRCCKRCGVSDEYEMLAYRGSDLVCQQCDCDMEAEWVSEDPDSRKHYLDTFSPLD